MNRWSKAVQFTVYKREEQTNKLTRKVAEKISTLAKSSIVEQVEVLREEFEEQPSQDELKNDECQPLADHAQILLDPLGRLGHRV